MHDLSRGWIRFQYVEKCESSSGIQPFSFVEISDRYLTSANLKIRWKEKIKTAWMFIWSKWKGKGCGQRSTWLVVIFKHDAHASRPVHVGVAAVASTVISLEKAWPLTKTAHKYWLFYISNCQSKHWSGDDEYTLHRTRALLDGVCAHSLERHLGLIKHVWLPPAEKKKTKGKKKFAYRVWKWGKKRDEKKILEL